MTFLPATIGVVAIIAVIAGTRWADRIAAGSAHDRVATVLGSLAGGVRATIAELRDGNWKLTGALGYFAFDVATLAAAFAAIGHAPALAAIMMAYLIGQLAGIVPVPRGLGVVDGGLVGALVLYGVPLAPATAAVLLYRAIALMLPAALGTVAFLVLRRDLDKPLILKPPRGTAQ